MVGGANLYFLKIFFSFFCVLRAISAVRAHYAPPPPKANRVKTFPNKRNRDRHVSSVHLGLTSRYECPECGKVCSQKWNLKKHVLVHSDTAGYACDICEKKFKRKYELERHSLIHSNEKPYMCEYCDKVFRCSHSLTEHLRIHT